MFAMPLQRGAQNNALVVDECIFCGSLQSDDSRLTDEHVVPDGLGWDLVIRCATCVSCQRRINPFEQRAIKTWFGIQRELFGVQSRKSARRKSASSNHVGVSRSGAVPRTQRQMLELHESGLDKGKTELIDLLENGGIYPVFTLPPGALFGRDPYERLPYSIMNLNSPKKSQEYTLSVKLNNYDFFRLIAKIAHCFAYIFSRSNDIYFSLPEFILGVDGSQSSHWIGASQLSLDTSSAHLVAISTRSVPLASVLGFAEVKAVVVTVGLFTGFGAPAYDVVVGYLKD